MSSRSRSFLILAAIALCLVVVATVVVLRLGGPQPADVIEVIPVSDDVVELIIDSCGGDPAVTFMEVDENTGAVTVSVESDQRSNNQCADILLVTLPDSNPVVLIDQTSGREFPLRPRQAQSGPNTTKE